MQDFKWPAGMPKRPQAKHPPLPQDVIATDGMRKRIVHERWIEFFQEEQRFFDLNRWKMRFARHDHKHGSSPNRVISRSPSVSR